VIRCLSFNTDLAYLRINGGAAALEPGFDPAITGYTARVFDGEGFTLSAAAADPGAQLRLDGALLEGGAEIPRPLEAGDNPFTLNVRAENGVSEKEYHLNVILVLRDAKEITAFGFLEPPATGEINGAEISVTVPHGTDRNGLAPVITYTGASISPASGVPQDFSAPVRYTVSAADGSTQDYTVTVAEAPRLYAITINGADGGTVVSDHEAAAAGTAVTLTVRPDAGYELKDGSLLANGAPLAGLGPDYTFTMPEADVLVTAAFVRKAGFDIEGPQDKIATVTAVHSAGREPPTDISYSGGESVTFTVNGPYTQEAGTLKWYVNGAVKTGAGSSLTIRAADYIKREYSLTVLIEDGGLWYSADSSFRVIQ
jgi:hypothetical protein